MPVPLPKIFCAFALSIWILQVAPLAKFHKNPSKNQNYIGSGTGRERNVLTQEQVLNMSFMSACNRFYSYYKIPMRNVRKYKWELLPNSTANWQESYWLLYDDPVSIRLLEDFLESSPIMCQFQYCVETGLVTLRGGSHGMTDRKRSMVAHSHVTIWAVKSISYNGNSIERLWLNVLRPYLTFVPFQIVYTFYFLSRLFQNIQISV